MIFWWPPMERVNYLNKSKCIWIKMVCYINYLLPSPKINPTLESNSHNMWRWEVCSKFPCFILPTDNGLACTSVSLLMSFLILRINICDYSYWPLQYLSLFVMYFWWTPCIPQNCQNQVCWIKSIFSICTEISLYFSHSSWVTLYVIITADDVSIALSV